MDTKISNRFKTGYFFNHFQMVLNWKDYLYGERVYIILSLLAKTTLAWLIFSGTLAPI